MPEAYAVEEMAEPEDEPKTMQQLVQEVCARARHQSKHKDARDVWLVDPAVLEEIERHVSRRGEYVSAVRLHLRMRSTTFYDEGTSGESQISMTEDGRRYVHEGLTQPMILPKWMGMTVFVQKEETEKHELRRAPQGNQPMGRPDYAADPEAKAQRQIPVVETAFMAVGMMSMTAMAMRRSRGRAAAAAAAAAASNGSGRSSSSGCRGRVRRGSADLHRANAKTTAEDDRA